MIIVVYYNQGTGKAHTVLQAPTLEGMPEPNSGDLALLLESPISLPGYVQDFSYVALSPPPTEYHEFDWHSKIWIDARTFNKACFSALDRVDEVAGKARLRYITSVPGQAETYQKKEEQARAWSASNFSGEPPSFIAAEASALGRDPVAVAQEVIGLADYWVKFKGPEIEACRRKWKVAIESATSVIQVDNLITQATTELDSL